MSQSLSRPIKLSKRSLIIVAIFFLTIYILLPRLRGFHIHYSEPKNWLYIALGLVGYSLTFLFASLTYRLLSFRRLKIGPLVLVQLSAVPLTLLLPVGISTLSLNYLWLKRKGYNAVNSAALVSLNNFVGLTANLSLLVILFLVFGINQHLIGNHLNKRIELARLVGLGLALLLLGLLIASYYIQRLIKIRKQLVLIIKSYAKHRLVLFLAVMSAGGQALVTGLVFWFCLRAYGVDLSFPLAYAIYGFSVLVGASFPTPGGLGGIEAGLVGALLAVHATSPDTAIAAVLAYRLVSYWIAVIVGLPTLFVLKKKLL